MRNLGQKLTSMGAVLGFSAIGLVNFSLAKAATVTDNTKLLIKEEFGGVFSLLSASSLLQEVIPELSEYSGFVVYEEDGTLNEWQINVDELDLNLSPESVKGRQEGDFILSPPASLNFELFPSSNWKLVIDFGIAFDAPRYSLEKGEGLTFTGQLGITGGYTYQDPSAIISSTFISESSSESSIPEPGMLLGIFTLGGLGLATKLKK